MMREVPGTCDFYPCRPLLKFDFLLPSDVGVIEDAASLVANVIGDRADSSNLERIDLALREALANAIVHGNRHSHRKAVRVGVGVLPDSAILLVVGDCGEGFDPDMLPDPLTPSNQLRDHGRGIFLIRQVADDVQFRFNGGMEVCILVRLSRRPQKPSPRVEPTGCAVANRFNHPGCPALSAES